MMEISLQINGQMCRAEKDETLLSVLNRYGIGVPTLCSMEGLSPSGACRMCVVELEGSDQLVPSCSYLLDREISILTHSPRVLRARKTNVELLLSNHPDDCLYCERNGSCELQDLAESLNIRERRIPGKKRQASMDHSSPAVVRDPAKCILCGRCVRVCEEVMDTSTFDFSGRGNRLHIATALDRPLNFTNCTSCGQCVVSCPTGALTEQLQWQRLHALIRSGEVFLAAQISTSALVAAGELLGRKSASGQGRLIREALYRCGFDLVTDSSLGADLMMVEQAAVFVSRLESGGEWPLITSSCPAWYNYAGMYHRELLPLLSPLKSPGQIMAGWLRNRWDSGLSVDGKKLVCVHFTGCTAAKAEAVRSGSAPKESGGTDLVLTTRELARFIRLSGLDLDLLEKELNSDRFVPEGGEVPDLACRDGALTAVAGGEAESSMRCIHHRLTGKDLGPPRQFRSKMHRSVMEATVHVGNHEFTMAAVSGLANANAFLHELAEGKRKAHFVEVMACPGGCINGGGQPVNACAEHKKSRAKAAQDLARNRGMGGAHDHPEIRKFYAEMQARPGGSLSRTLFYRDHLPTDPS